jgi:hypothetical protein
LNNFNCGWCPTSGQAEACTDADVVCTDTSTPVQACSSSVTFTAAECPNNCTGPDNGVCGTDPATNATICICKSDKHGIDCSLVGGLNVGALAGAISGGVIAAIVIVGAVVLVIVVIGTKKAVDWAMLNNMAMANSNARCSNPCRGSRG